MNKTDIEWTDFSSNPLYVVDRETSKRGWFCEKVSPGCANCYASALNVRRGTGHEYVTEHRDKVEWRLNERELEAILRRRKPARIFMCDMTDLFHEDVPFRWIGQVWRVMNDARQHTFQVLTKRPARMRDFLRWMEASHHDALEASLEAGTWPLPNVHLGVSVENQRYADVRIPVLLDTPAAVRFLSCEPLLGGLNLRPWLQWEGEHCQTCGRGYSDVWSVPDDIWNKVIGHPGGLRCTSCFEVEARASGISVDLPPPTYEPPLSWVIVGGESGPGSAERKLVERCPGGSIPCGGTMPCGWCDGTGWRPKPQALARVRSLRDQCQAAGVPFFFKQWPIPPHKSGGPALIDGEEWRQMP